uniref:Uncharacterized protein n=1 Tax=Glossina austeni TaxID=7395 RepID=A0A1A9V1P2_GLOAU
MLEHEQYWGRAAAAHPPRPTLIVFLLAYLRFDDDDDDDDDDIITHIMISSTYLDKITFCKNIVLKSGAVEIRNLAEELKNQLFGFRYNFTTGLTRSRLRLRFAIILGKNVQFLSNTYRLALRNAMQQQK